MVIAEYDIASGTALLLAAAPNGKSRLIDAASVLPALAAVPPPSLTGAAASTVVELADPVDPQTVLTRLRSAAATPGPLSVYIAGQLHFDQKQRLPHLALARSTPSTLRYTALPWHWLASEFGGRAPGTTTVVVDLVADAAAFQRLRPEDLSLGQGTDLYGHVAPPPAGRRRTAAVPGYLQACAAIWRGGGRSPLAEVHELAAAQAAHPEALLLAAYAPPNGLAAPGDGLGAPGAPAAATPGAALPGAAPPGPVAPAPVVPEPEEVPDPHPAILAAAHAGRHGEAAAIVALWESAALRTHGANSPQAVHWLEVRADLARIGDDPARSCELWMAAAESRLALQQPPDDPDVRAAADRAHHQWTQVHDAGRARELASSLTALRDQVPGAQPGALQAIRQRLDALNSAPTAHR